MNVSTILRSDPKRCYIRQGKFIRPNQFTSAISIAIGLHCAVRALLSIVGLVFFSNIGKLTYSYSIIATKSEY